MQHSQLSNDLVDELAGRLSSDWYKLGIELDLDMKIINNINDRSRVHAERWPLRMLQEWRKTKHRSRHEQMVELVQALDKIHRSDLVAVVRHSMEESTDEEISDRLLLQLAEGVNIEWYNLGIQLNFPTEKMDVIKMEVAPDQRLEPGVAMLRAFREQYSGVNIIEDLKKALREIRRLDLARYIDENCLPPSERKPHSTPLPGSPKHHARPQAAASVSSSKKKAHSSPLPGSPKHVQPQALSAKSKSSTFHPQPSFQSYREPQLSCHYDGSLSGGPTLSQQSSLNTGFAPLPSSQRRTLLAHSAGHDDGSLSGGPTFSQQSSLNTGFAPLSSSQRGASPGSPRHLQLQAHSTGDDGGNVSRGPPSNPQSSSYTGILSPTSSFTPSSIEPPRSQSESYSIVTSGAPYIPEDR